MAAQSVGARTAASPDHIQLHAHAMNSLSRCMRELRGDRADYETAELHLADAADALRMLAALEAHAAH